MAAESEQSRKSGEAFAAVVETVETLRDPGGCPWDAEQTHVSLRQDILEEVYEFLEAIEDNDAEAMEEELGDLLIHVVFHADIARRAGEFDAESMARKVVDKLRRRHPHVFGDGEKLGSAEEVVDKWEALKRQERGRNSVVASLPSAMPALAYSTALQKRAIKAGVDWPNHDEHPLFARHEGESDRAAERRAGRFLMRIALEISNAGVDPETALRTASVAFRDSVLRAEEAAGDRALADLSDDERARVWEEARQQ